MKTQGKPIKRAEQTQEIEKEIAENKEKTKICNPKAGHYQETAYGDA
jgi:hypothetical protein